MKLSTAILQRNQAFACFVLSAGIVIAIFASVFGPSAQDELLKKRAEIARHVQILRENEKVLADNQRLLSELIRSNMLIDKSTSRNK